MAGSALPDDHCLNPSCERGRHSGLCSEPGTELERRRGPVTGEVLPRDGDDDSGLTLTVGEAWGLWDWLEANPDAPRYWEENRLYSLQRKLSNWVRTDAPW